MKIERTCLGWGNRSWKQNHTFITSRSVPKMFCLNIPKTVFFNRYSYKLLTNVTCHEWFFILDGLICDNMCGLSFSHSLIKYWSGFDFKYLWKVFVGYLFSIQKSCYCFFLFVTLGFNLFKINGVILHYSRSLGLFFRPSPHANKCFSWVTWRIIKYLFYFQMVSITF